MQFASGTSSAGDRPLDLFHGCGEVGALMRDLRWESTPLGPPESWPQSLRTVVRILLTSRYAMWMGWGDELTFLYNDAYAAMSLGAKHPWALGRPSREVWAEIWPQIGPRIERVLTTGEATWDERLQLFLERSGYREETYHTFSYSPLSDEEGLVRGHLCVVTEETERVLDERRLTTLGLLGAHLAAAKTDEEVFGAVEYAAAHGAQDLPFALVYSFEEGKARLRARGNVTAGRESSADLPIAELLDLCGVASGTAEGRALLTSRDGVVRATPAIFKGYTEVWGTPSAFMIVLPLSVPGQDSPVGLMVAGSNPFRRQDAKYRNFVGLFAGQVSAALSAARAYEEERRRVEALAALDRAKTTFFSNISHEFRTPLTLMLGPTEDALSTRDGALSGEDLHTVHRNQLRLLKLVNTLLDYSRLEAGRTRARFEPVDLAAETAGLASVFRSAVERAGLQLEVDAPALSAPVFLDRELWERVVLNLLSNALKFTFEGRIRVAVVDGHDHAEIAVDDTGVGIPPDALSRVFDRFHRVEGTRARTHEGSGIGLALVHDIVALHGGRVVVVSEVGRGTRFTVHLPFGKDHLPADAVAVASTAEVSASSMAEAFVAEAERWLPGTDESQRGAGAAGTSGRVLVVDDNADMRSYVARLLRRHWDVETAADGEAALAAIQRDPPGVVLTDVMMPNLDGFGLLRALRADPRTADLPVVMLSARAGDEARIEGLNAGADDYLVKPFTAGELVARIASQLGGARARKEVRDERDRLRQLLGDVPAIINFLSGPDFVFEYVHPLARKALGGRELLGKPLLEAIPEYRVQPTPFIAHLRDVYAHGIVCKGEAVRVLLDRDGTGDLIETFWDYVYLPVRDSSGMIGGVMTFDIEVTDQVRTRQQLEQATRAKDEFLAMLGHELRNPLAPIFTALQLLELKGVREGAKERAIIARQTRHLARLVDDLLDVSRIARGQFELRKASVDVADVIAKAVEVASPLVEIRNQRLDVRVESGLTVHADAARLAQAVSNLLTNSAKYSDPDTTITVCAERSGGDLEIRVVDQGMGIDGELLPRVFDLFAQGRQSSARSEGGLGLGLAIVRNIMELHGGSATASSEGPGHGSQFVLRLPVLDAPTDVAARLGPRPARATRALDVLIVDDNDDAAQTLEIYLGLRGFAVRTARDAADALRTLRDSAADVALVDIGLPGVDGYEFAALVKQDPRLAGVRLVAVTGYGQEKDRQRTKAAGFEAHVVKPVDPAALEALLSHELEAQSGGEAVR